MSQENGQGRIRIVSMPKGEAPDEIKREWIGVEIPCIMYEGTACPDSQTHGAVSGEKEEFCQHYVVYQQSALLALQKKSKDAAEWWLMRGFPQYVGALFSFDAECVQVVEPVLSREELLGENN